MAVNIAEKENPFLNFQVHSVLSVDKKTKCIALCGKFPNDSEHDAVLVIDKLPLTQDTVEIMFRSEIDAVSTFWNDIYGQFLAYSYHSLGDVKVTVIYPASKKHIIKYSSQEEYMFQETPDMYKNIIKPYIDTQISDLGWVYNILDGVCEADRVLFNDSDPINGFLIVPDLKWDNNDIDNLYLVAIVRRRDLQSLRDIDRTHLQLLRNIHSKGKEIVQSLYGLNGSQLRFYIHYHPSFYHFHVHITNLKYESAGVMAGRAHLLDDVIDNVENIDANYYQKKCLCFVLKENHELTKRLKSV